MSWGEGPITAHFGWAVVVHALVAVTVAGCVTTGGENGVRPSSPSEVIDQVRAVDLSPRYPQPTKSVEVTNASPGSQPVSFFGDGSPATAKATSSPHVETDEGPTTTGAIPRGPAGGQGYEMNFENTPITTVAKTVLGDILGVGYTIDPRVQGTVSLSSGRPVPKKDILYVLESALRVSNVALVREARGYRLIPTAEANASGSIDGGQRLEPGYGITVLPLQFVSAQTLAKLLDNFATKQGMVRTDPSRNLVVIQGSGADRRAAIDAVLSFDADWMRGQSVGIYPVSNSAPEPIIAELERIIDSGEGGLSQNIVKLQPIGRQNAILVVTRRPDFLKTVSTWITRLDRSGNAGTGVKVYRMRYGDARQVAAVLNDLFLNNPGSGLDSSTNQLAPGGRAIATSSERLGANSPQQTNAVPGAHPPSTGTPPSFDARYADASAGRFAQGSALPAGPPWNGPGNLNGSPPILQGVRIAADVVNNALLIYANQENYRIIERTLQQLDRPQLQVSIDATIAEVTLNDNLNYGVQFFLQSRDAGLKSDTGSVVNTTSAAPTSAAGAATTVASALLSRALPGFNFLAGMEAQPQVILNALHAVTDVKVLSTPSLVVMDNQSASLQVGDQIPITTGTATVLNTNNTVVNTVDYRNTGVILRVAPRINANGNVLLDIEQEISSVAANANATSLTPTVSQRKVRSSISVASGQTVLVGGLISETQNRTHNGIPGLDQIPGFSALVSNNTGAVQRTELIIFIRPQIIRNGADAHRIADELRAKMTGRLGASRPSILEAFEPAK